MPDLKGKVAIITGASAGIGEGIAKHLASLGCWLSLTARNMENLEKVAEACRGLGLPRDKVIVVPGDVTVEKDVENVVQKTANHFGRIDILVNNAGITRSGTVEGTSVEDFKMVWDINFNGPLCMMKNAMPYLRQTKGNVVNISSISSMKSHNIIVPYSTSKAALNHLTQCAALENAPYGVRVNGICPCFIKTLIGKPPNVSEEDHYKIFEKMAAATQAIKRVGSPEEVGRCVAFLASDDAAFITGISMPMDAGHLLLSSISGPPTLGEAPAQTTP